MILKPPNLLRKKYTINKNFSCFFTKMCGLAYYSPILALIFEDSKDVVWRPAVFMIFKRE